MTDLAVLYRESTALAAEVERLRTAPIYADDPRLTLMWDEAMGVANDEGMCEVYDEIVDELGGPTREREYEVCTSISITIHTHINVHARSADAAIQTVDMTSEADVIDALLGGRYDLDRENVTLDNIDGSEATTV